MPAKFRYRCARCGYKTRWLDEHEGAEQLRRHCLRSHPGTEPGGDFEIRRGDESRGGCVGMAATPFVLLFVSIRSVLDTRRPIRPLTTACIPRR